MRIVPKPKKISRMSKDTLLLLPATISRSVLFPEALDVFCQYAERIGISVQIQEKAWIRVEQDFDLVSGAYRIAITEDAVLLTASDLSGMNHAFASLLQMMEVGPDAQHIYLPKCVVEDQPDCEFRGLMVALGFIWHDFSYLLQYVDMCYFYKISVLHLDMSNRSLYTLPSKKYPKLPSENGHYTEEQIAQLVAYASARGIEIMPEIDVPGHCRCLGEAYPELFGTDNLIHLHEDAIQAVQDLFKEACALFPNSKYIHLGGDEADIKQWLACPECQAYIRKMGLNEPATDDDTLKERCYAHFINEMAKTVFECGRQPIVWEGFGKAGNDYISKDVIVMSWENYYQLTPELLDAGFTIINCSWAPLYVVTPWHMWTPEEVYNWNLYKWQPVHPDSPYLKDGFEMPQTEKVIGAQLLAWGGPNILKGFERVEEGLVAERTFLIERLPYVAQNTWNIQKNTTWDEISANVEILTERLNLIIQGGSYGN